MSGTRVHRGHGVLSHHRAVRQGEVRLPAAVAVLFAAAMHATLPNALLFVPRWLLPAVEVALLVAVVVANPKRRLSAETRWSRMASLTLTTVIIVANTVTLGYLLVRLTSAHLVDGRPLLLAAAQVWVTNMIAFALVFWELDRDGPVARLPGSGKPTGRFDFQFPQDDQATADAAMGEPQARWMPVFVDYLFLSITNSVAFSPTDTLPLSSRAKILMAVEAMAALVTSLLVIARAVNILN